MEGRWKGEERGKEAQSDSPQKGKSSLLRFDSLADYKEKRNKE